MFYAVRHFTRFRYSLPVWQSAMELRMQPRSENTQRCFSFQLSISPQARVFSYKDHLGNLVHHFDVPGHHQQLTIIADALVEVENPSPLPQSLGPGAWDELDAMIDREDYCDMLMPSRFACTSPEVEELAKALEVVERGRREPLELLTTLNSRINQHFFTQSAAQGSILPWKKPSGRARACVRILRTP
jgi:transglutaminase-like putative cysteine protease